MENLPLKKRRLASAASTDVEVQEPIPRVSTSQICTPGSSYQVFLSFRGEDTRKGFADHLYHALVDAGICVFRDDDSLRVGMEIDPDLRRAISESKISIPVLSQMYASSKWCLQELTQMIARKNSSRHMVLPILYKVEPSHVRHQKGSFGRAFDLLREQSEPKDVEEWKQALKDVTSMKVWESEKIANGHEAKLVKEVVETVLSKLEDDFRLDVFPEDLVGIDCHVEEIMGFADSYLSSTKMIGIYGMGGIGKTTLAKHIYNKLSKRFVHRCFIPDIREKCILPSQRKLISDVLRIDADEVKTIDDGVNIIRNRFRSKQALILLDDVDNEDQLDNLTREHAWFGSGSKIIVTTRDEGVLDRAKFGVDFKYELNVLDSQQSLRLFSRHAFRSDSPSSEFQCLSSDVAATTGGLPLALKVIGSLLFGERDRKVWEETKKMLKSAPNEEVQKMLKISYNKLDPKAQQIFLDIACFFNGEGTTYAIYFWDDCDFFPRIQIRLLVSRCLLKIEGDRFKMHDQLRDLGRAIIRQEDYDHPKDRSRLWDSIEALSILKRREGTEKIRAILMSRVDGLVHGKQVDLPNLRMFHVDNASFMGDFRLSFSELRWLRWRNVQIFGAQYLGKGDERDLLNFGLDKSKIAISEDGSELLNFDPEKLVILEISGASISENWVGWSLMKRLKVLHIRFGYLSQNFPDMSRCTNLEILSFQNCPRLKQINPFVGGMKILVSLNLSGCGNLKELPTKVSFEELKELIIDRTAICEIPKWIVSLQKLEMLSAQGCQHLAQIPEVGNLYSLKVLVIDDTAICKIPEWIVSLKKLETLSAQGCQRLARIPEIGNLHSLKVLRLKRTSISKLPEMIFDISSLQVLDVENCHQLGFMPNLPCSLTSLLLTCEASRLPNLFELVNLKELKLTNCRRLEVIPELPSKLLRLVISGCIKLEELPNLSHLKQLTEVILSYCPKLTKIIGLKGLKSRTRLYALGCPKLFRFDGLQDLESCVNA